MEAGNVHDVQAFDLGYQEIQLQVWGTDAATMYSVGQDIAGIDDRVVVKVPVTGDGVAVAARLKRQKAQVTATAVYSSRQALAAIGVGADFIAPYLGRMNQAGRNVRLHHTPVGKGWHEATSLAAFSMTMLCSQDS